MREACFPKRPLHNQRTAEGTEPKSPKDLPESETEQNVKEGWEAVWGGWGGGGVVILEQSPRQKRALARAEGSGPAATAGNKDITPRGTRGPHTKKQCSHFFPTAAVSGHFSVSTRVNKQPMVL